MVFFPDLLVLMFGNGFEDGSEFKAALVSLCFTR